MADFDCSTIFGQRKDTKGAGAACPYLTGKKNVHIWETGSSNNPFPTPYGPCETESSKSIY